jgi:hypothetical protein
VNDFLSAEECKTLIEHTEEIGYEDAPVATHEGAVMMKELRDNWR